MKITFPLGFGTRASQTACLLVVVLIGLLHIPPTAAAAEPPGSAEKLRSQLQAAFQAKDTNAVLALVNWRGVADTMKADETRMMAFMAARGADSVKLLPLPANFQPTNELNGVRYYPNVHVQGFLQIETIAQGNTNTTQMPYGESGGAFYLSGTVQETFDANAKKAVPLALMVMGLFPKETPGILSCSYVYVAGGKEKTDSFQCTNNWSTSFWGDYVKSCKVTKLSGAGSFQLRIQQGTDTVFDSKMVKTNDSITYERKQP